MANLVDDPNNNNNNKKRISVTPEDSQMATDTMIFALKSFFSATFLLPFC